MAHCLCVLHQELAKYEEMESHVKLTEKGEYVSAPPSPGHLLLLLLLLFLLLLLLLPLLLLALSLLVLLLLRLLPLFFPLILLL